MVDPIIRKMTRRSSLCSHLELKVPEAWNQLTQEQLRYVLTLMTQTEKLPQRPGGLKLASFLYFTGIEVIRGNGRYYLCRKEQIVFLLDAELLPDLLEKVEWIDHEEEMNVRIERVGKHEAADFDLQTLMFGNYLQAEAFYQAAVNTTERKHLESLVRILYNIPDNEDIRIPDYVATGALLWFAAAKVKLGKWFPHILRPMESGGPVTQENMVDSMRAQIRMLTKGDVSKKDYILNHVDTWTALEELDAQAQELEEIKQRNGSK